MFKLVTLWCSQRFVVRRGSTGSKPQKDSGLLPPEQFWFSCIRYLPSVFFSYWVPNLLSRNISQNHYYTLEHCRLLTIFCLEKGVQGSYPRKIVDPFISFGVWYRLFTIFSGKWVWRCHQWKFFLESIMLFDVFYLRLLTIVCLRRSSWPPNPPLATPLMLHVYAVHLVQIILQHG